MTDTFYIGQTIHRLGAPDRLFIWDTVSTLKRPNWARQQARLCLWYGRAGEYRSRRYMYRSGSMADYRVREAGAPKPAGYVAPADIWRERQTGLYPQSIGPAKPAGWLAAMIANCTRGTRVFDPYAGGGTTLAACERIGRTATLVDIDPLMVAGCLETAERLGLEVAQT